MFRRHRTSFGPTASAAGWAADSGFARFVPARSRRPALTGGDPFAGWPPFDEWPPSPEAGGPADARFGGYRARGWPSTRGTDRPIGPPVPAPRVAARPVRARPAGPAPAAQAWPPLPGQVEDDQPPGVDEFDDPAEVGALAAAFAADYLSWDEADPDRRGAALARYLPRGNPADPSLLGWSGKGRQRAEFALPGSVRGVGREVVLVDVRVRVTPYRPLGAAPNGGPGRAEPRVPGAPLAAAPAPTARGWQGLASRWVRLDVPIKRDRGRLVVDGSDERLAAAGGEAAP